MPKKPSKMSIVHKKYGQKLKLISARQKKLENLRVKTMSKYQKEIERTVSEGG